MDLHAENCMICGKPLVYFEAARPARCHLCGAENATITMCEAGHYVCDACHAHEGIAYIKHYVLHSDSTSPVHMATEMMHHPSIHMHGPEHHVLVALALLAAFKNAGGHIDLAAAVDIAAERGSAVPGGICGMWGSCGAGIGVGIFVSVLTGATPLSEKEWSLANMATSRSLAILARLGGPRCCKRNTYAALTYAVLFAEENFGVQMDLVKRIQCNFSHRNAQCRQKNCYFFPGNLSKAL